MKPSSVHDWPWFALHACSSSVTPRRGSGDLPWPSRSSTAWLYFSCGDSFGAGGFFTHAPWDMLQVWPAGHLRSTAQAECAAASRTVTARMSERAFIVRSRLGAVSYTH